METTEPTYLDMLRSRREVAEVRVFLAEFIPASRLPSFPEIQEALKADDLDRFFWSTPR